MEESHTNPQEPQQETGPDGTGPPFPTAVVSSPNTNAPPSVYQPPGGGSTIGYFLTLVGILKIFSVLLGIPNLSLLVYGYFTANLFSSRYNRGQICDWTKNPITVEDCTEGPAYRDQVCLNENSYYKSIGLNNATKICPSRMLVIPQIYFIGFVWASTFLVLIVQTCRHLTKKKTFITIDFIGHLIAGCLTIVSSLCIFGYFGMVQEEDMCSEKNFIGPRPPEVPHIYKTYQHVPKGSRENDNDSEFQLSVVPYYCLTVQHDRYRKWIFLSAAIIALINGLLYIVIALLTRTKYGQSKIRPVTTMRQQPWSMPQRSQAPSQMYQQQFNYGGYPPSQQKSYSYKSTSYPKQQGFATQQQYPQSPSQAPVSN